MGHIFPTDTQGNLDGGADFKSSLGACARETKPVPSMRHFALIPKVCLRSLPLATSLSVSERERAHELTLH
jgi:hypothetical protein